MATESKPLISDELLRQMERIAAAQHRYVNDVVKDAVEQYINNEEFKEVLSFGKRHAKARGLKPSDVNAAIHKIRGEACKR